MPNKPDKPPSNNTIPFDGGTTISSIEERAKARLAELVAARDQVRQQLAAIENQIYAITDLLNPKKDTPDALTDTITPADTPPGTI